MKICYPVTTPEASAAIMGMYGDFSENIRYLKECGFDGVELMIRNPEEIEVARLQDELEANGLKIAAVGVTPMVMQDKLKIASDDASIRAQALNRAFRSVELASKLKAPFCIGSFRGSVSEEKGNTLKDACTAFSEICACAKTMETEVLFEPQSAKNGNYLNSLQEGLDWIEQVGADNLKMILDVFHMNLVSADLVNGAKAAKGKFGLVHMCDSDRQVMGSGTFDLVPFLKEIYDQGYNGFISTEIKQLPDMKKAANMSADYFRYLERVIF